VHSSVQSPALMHLQMVHPRFDLQPHLISSLQELQEWSSIWASRYNLVQSTPVPSGVWTDDLLFKYYSDIQHVLHVEVEHPKISYIELHSLLCICYSIPLLVVDAQESCSF